MLRFLRGRPTDVSDQPLCTFTPPTDSATWGLMSTILETGFDDPFDEMGDAERTLIKHGTEGREHRHRSRTLNHLALKRPRGKKLR